MAKRMQQTLPANLQYYQRSGGYVPPHIQQQMAQHMQQTLPANLKQYIGPYMQQRVATQYLTPEASLVAQSTPHPLSEHQISHDLTHLSERHELPGMTVSPTISPQTSKPQDEVQPSGPAEPYDFITNPPSPPKTSFLDVFHETSLPKLLGILGGGFVVCLLLIVILHSFLSTSFDLSPFLSVLQDQQELIHLTSEVVQNPSEQAALPPTYNNFIATTQATVTSSQNQLINYLLLNKQKINPKDISLKELTTTDSQLLAAVTSNTFPSTFQSIMTTELNTYRADIRFAYNQTTGKNGHIELLNEYKQTGLLLKQLNEANSAVN
jgi:hypothetical protein